MIDEEIFFNSKRILGELKNFSLIKKKKNYNYINYEKYQKFKQSLNEYETCKVFTKADDILKKDVSDICFLLDSKCYVFSIKDNSFGQYFYEEVYMAEICNTINGFSTTDSRTEICNTISDCSCYTTTNYLNDGCTGTITAATIDYDTTYTKTPVDYDIAYTKTSTDYYTGAPVITCPNPDTYVYNDASNAKKKEKKDMSTTFNFDFGPVNNEIHLSIYGVAVKNYSTNTWQAYNPNTQEIVDVNVLNFPAEKFMYKMPVAISDVSVGDVILHNKRPVFVTAVPEDKKKLEVIDVANAEEKKILPVKNLFGFDYVTKVVSLFGDLSKTANAENPFGNMLLPLLMSENKEIDPMLLAMTMNNKNMEFNPMMLMLMGDKVDDKALMLMMMMNNNK